MKNTLRGFAARGLFVTMDVAIVSASNVLILIAAARLLGAHDLASFTLVQVISAGIVAVVRGGAVLVSAMSSQRTQGRGRIPHVWLAWIQAPVAIVAASPLAVVATSASSERAPLSAGVIVLLGWYVFALLFQDFARQSAFADAKSRAAVVADGSGAVVTLLLLAVLSSQRSVTSFFLAASVGSTVAGTFLSFLLGIRTVRLPALRIGPVIRVGKWAAIDVGLSQVANVLPLAVTALSLASSEGGAYRVLQSTQGPLNIVSSAFITSLVSRAWAYSDPQSLDQLRRRVRRSSLLLGAGTAAYIVLAELLLVGLTGQRFPIFICAVVAFSAILGGFTAPFNAGAIVLGRQRLAGASIRVIVVAFSIAVSLAAVSGLWVPWSDPIASEAVFSAVVGIVGWWLGYRNGLRRTQL